MATAHFQFHDDLALFLAPEHRARGFRHECARAATLKNAIESLGVPHTETGAVIVNGASATLQRAVREGDEVLVFPAQPQAAAADAGFLADAHLGGLARFLRMLGYDTLHDQAWADREICRIAHDEQRIVLTRDRELLKHRDIAHGCYVRALKPEAQLRELVTRYRLGEGARPFTRCLRCNLPLVPIDRASAAERVPARVLALHERFTRCAGCARIYWPGTHYERMRAIVFSALGQA